MRSHPVTVRLVLVTDAEIDAALAVFGAAIRRRREAAGLAPAACASAAGLAAADFAGIEAGSREPELDEMHAIARALGLRLSQLLRDAEDARAQVS